MRGVATTDWRELPPAATAGLFRLVCLFFVAIDADATDEGVHDPKLAVLREVLLFLVDVDGGDAGIEI